MMAVSSRTTPTPPVATTSPLQARPRDRTCGSSTVAVLPMSMIPDSARALGMTTAIQLTYSIENRPTFYVYHRVYRIHDNDTNCTKLFNTPTI